MTPLHSLMLLVPLLPLTHAVDKTSNPTLDIQLRDSPTTLDRHSLLSSSSDWVYDFNGASPYPDEAFKPGSVKNANAATFPALTGMGMTLAQLNLGPCAMLPPHLHPRATNLVVAITGNTTTYMWNENGVKLVKAELTPGVMTIFPQGSLHAMQNNGCDDAYLISALNSDDTGTLNILNGLYEMPNDIIRAAFGNSFGFDTESIGKNIPPPGTGSVIGSAECLSRCRLNKDGTHDKGRRDM